MTLHGSATLPALPRGLGLDAGGKFGTLKPCPYGPASALHVGPNSPRGSPAPPVGAKRSLEKAPGKCTDTGLLTSERDAAAEWGFRERHSLDYALANRTHCEKN